MLIEAHMLTLEHFKAIATANPLVNHGRRWDVTYGERQSAFSDADTAEDAVADVHEALVNNALYMCQPEFRESFGQVQLPPAEVLALYPHLADRFPTLGLSSGAQATLAL